MKLRKIKPDTKVGEAIAKLAKSLGDTFFIVGTDDCIYRVTNLGSGMALNLTELEKTVR